MSNERGALVLVTGATGFLAHHIIQLLLREGYRVRGTVRNLKNSDKLKSLKNLCPHAKFPLELVEADLTKDDGWNDALTGCDYCMHVACPVLNTVPKKEEDLIIPALDGTMRVLRACSNSGTIRRVVLTSSTAAVHPETSKNENRVFNEKDWTDLSSQHVDAYTKSKTLAEKAAWDFCRTQKLELAVINPCALLGPYINSTVCTSLGCVKRLMDRSVFLIPDVCIPICDARDVAFAHLRVMTDPQAANKRYIVISSNLWLKDIANILRKEFAPYGYYIPSIRAPYILLYLFRFLHKSIKLILPRYGKECSYSNTRMIEELKIEPRKVESIILDTAYSLIECGILPKTTRYKDRKC